MVVKYVVRSVGESAILMAKHISTNKAYHYDSRAIGRCFKKRTERHKNNTNYTQLEDVSRSGYTHDAPRNQKPGKASHCAIGVYSNETRRLASWRVDTGA